MDDLISRQETIEAIESRTYRHTYLDQIVGIIKDLPTAQQWIPCSERMPEKPGKYLVTVKNGNVYAGTFDVISGKFQCAATAWMQLPEPWRGEGHG